MPFPTETNGLQSVTANQSLAAGGHAARHNEVKAAIESIRDVLGGGSLTPGTLNLQGNVGIGTSSPADLLHINNDGRTFTRIQRNSTDALAAALQFIKQRGTGASPTGVASGDDLGYIQFTGLDSTAGANRVFAQIQGAVDGTPGSGDAPGRLMFSTTADGSATLSERMRIDNAGLITGSGTSLGAWTAYTPTLGGTGWAIGNGTVVGYYCQIGKTVHWYARITFGSTSTFGAGALTVTLPVTASSRNQTEHSANATYNDVSLSTRYSGLGLYSSTTTIQFRSTGSGATATVTTSAPFTWASGDIIGINGTYEIA